ncbi:hypothetical protein EJB05_18134, partial [Eragrostis curvula]
MHVSSMSLLPSCSWLAIVLISLLLISRPGTVAGDGQPPSKPIVTPITRDPSTSLYTIPVKNGIPLVLDLAGSLVWSTCQQQGHRTIPCKSSACKVANRNRPASCASAANGGNADDPHCACTTYPYNPVSGHCGNGDLTVVPLAANATDGKRPLFPVSFNALGSCAPDGLLESLPSGAAGVAGLSRLPLSLPSQVASKLKVAKQFALCLPSGDGGQTGAAVFGGGPFQLMANWPPPSDLAEELRRGSLPLVKNPKNKGAYYFRVHGIAVNEELVPLAPGALDLDARSGRGGVVFSTVTPYTTLRSDIFNALIAAFDRATSRIPRRKPPPPNNLCFEASGFSWNALGPGVAIIDLMLDNQRNWSLPGVSSLVQVSGDTLCFAFQNMGSPASEAPDAPAIIFGTHQMVNNLVQFDLEKNTFGFSGLLNGRRTQCGRFDFNMGTS